jgi:hypothetical protein
MKRILMVSWYNFNLKFWWTQRCLWIFNNLPNTKFLLSYSETNKNKWNYFYVKSLFWKYSKYFQMLVYFSPYNIIKTYFVIKKIKVDIVFAESMWTLIPLCIFKKSFWHKLYFDTHNFEYEYYNQKWKIVLSKIIFIYEKFCCKVSDKIIVCSKREKELFMVNYNLKSEKIIVLANWMNPPLIVRDKDSIIKEFAPNNEVIITFIWKLDYLPNKEAVDFLVSNIDKVEWNIKILIIWPWSEIYSTIQTDKIVFVWYKENIYDYINASDICLSPIEKWSGTRLKMFEYIILNKTILSTPKGAEWIDIKDVEWLFITEMSIFIDKLNHVIENKIYLNKNDNTFFIEKYLWKNLVSRFIHKI